MRDPLMLQAWKMGMAPDWVMQDIDHAINDLSRFLSPDVAALKSMSLSAKVHVNRRRAREEYVAKIERQTLIDMAREAYWHKKHAGQS